MNSETTESSFIGPESCTQTATQEKKTVLECINSKIANCEHQIKAANDIVEDGNANLRAALDVDGSKKRIERDVVQAAQSKVDIWAWTEEEVRKWLEGVTKEEIKIIIGTKFALYIFWLVVVFVTILCYCSYYFVTPC